MDFELIIRTRGEKKLEISPPGVSGTFLSLSRFGQVLHSENRLIYSPPRGEKVV
jgi:hypothetical protein